MRRSGSAQRLTSALLFMYPPRWRKRYGEEFHQLLLDELDEQRPSLLWWLNLFGHAVWARLTEWGIAGDGDRTRCINVALRMTGAAVAVGWLCGAAMWAQLAVGWQWSAPASHSTRIGVELTTAGLVGLTLCGGLLAAGSLMTAMRGGRFKRPGPRIALAVVCVCGVLVVLGAGWIGLSWPGSGGHAWAGRSLVPAWMGRRMWALTLWLSTYWAHPHQLAALGPAQIGWMLMGPLLMAVLVCAWRQAIGAIGFVLPRWASLGVALGAAVCMAVTAIGAAAWSLDGRTGPHGLFVSGTTDIGLFGITGVLTVACALMARRIALAPQTVVAS